jgi:hypothetical protein
VSEEYVLHESLVLRGVRAVLHRVCATPTEKPRQKGAVWVNVLARRVKTDGRQAGSKESEEERLSRIRGGGSGVPSPPPLEQVKNR